MQDGRRDDTTQEEQVLTQDIEEQGKNIEQELEQLKGLSQQLDNNYKRALADYQNLQRRTQEEKTEWIRMAGRDLILKMLPVLDTLVLAAKHLQDKGLDLSIDQFLRILKEEGVTKIETLGHEFDPHTMEAVMTQDAKKEDKGKVIEEVRAGYMFGDHVLRAAQVMVGK